MKRQQKGMDYVAPQSDALKFELRSQFQRDVLKSIHRNHVTALIGGAGSGKTLLAAYGAMQLMHGSQIKKIAVVRLAREMHYETIGTLPGILDEKLSYISAPIYDNLQLMMPKMAIDKWVSDGKLEIMPISYLRGRSLHDTYLIVEEAQNLPREVMITVLSRIASGSKIVITCDPLQEDFGRLGTSEWIEQLLSDVEGCRTIYMPSAEIYRHPIIPGILANAAKYKKEWVAPTKVTNL